MGEEEQKDNNLHIKSLPLGIGVWGEVKEQESRVR
jgi:hypothetical protein